MATNSFNEGRKLCEETLSHYGVPGMKWGVRKKPDFPWKWPSPAEEKIGEEINDVIKKERAKAAKAAEKERKKQEAEAKKVAKKAASDAKKAAVSKKRLTTRLSELRMRLSELVRSSRTRRREALARSAGA